MKRQARTPFSMEKKRKAPAVTGLGDMKVDDFLSGGFLSATGSAHAEHTTQKKQKEQKKGTSVLGEQEAGVAKGKRITHKEELDALKEKDPDFYKYLQQTDQELLNFEDDEEEEEEEEEEDDDKEEQIVQPRNKRPKVAAEAAKEVMQGKEEVTQHMAERWCSEAKSKASPTAMGLLTKAYRVACHLGDTEEEMDATLQICSSAVFNTLILFIIKEAPGIFARMLQLPAAGQPTWEQIRASKRWKKVEPLVKSYIGNTLHLLGQMTDSTMVVFTLRNLRPAVPYLACSERLQRKVQKHVLLVLSEGQTAARVQAIVFIRTMAIALPSPALASALKGVYRAFVSGAKFMSPANAGHIDFMASCVVEMFGLDSAVSYEQGFSHVQQLAQLMRNALGMKSKDALREVYCWQTISTLELWAKVLAAHGQQELRGLVYPVAQLLLAAVRLVPSPQYFPLHLRCIRALNRLARACDVYIPVSSLVLQLLQWKGFRQPAKSAAPEAPRSTMLRAGAAMLQSPIFQQMLLDDALLQLAEHWAQWSCSPALPELAHVILMQLRKCGQGMRSDAQRSAVKGLAAALQSNAAFVVEHRNHVKFGPKDKAGTNFLADDFQAKKAPLQQYAELLANKAVQHGRKEVVVQAAGGRGNMQQEAEVEEGDEVALMGADHIPAAVKSRLARWQPEEEDVVDRMEDYEVSDTDKDDCD